MDMMITKASRNVITELCAYFSTNLAFQSTEKVIDLLEITMNSTFEFSKFWNVVFVIHCIYHPFSFTLLSKMKNRFFMSFRFEFCENWLWFSSFIWRFRKVRVVSFWSRLLLTISVKTSDPLFFKHTLSKHFVLNNQMSIEIRYSYFC